MSSDYLSKRQSVSDIRRENLRQIMTLLARYKTLTRHEICARTGLTGAGLSRNIRELVDAGLVKDLPEESSQNQKGRRRSILSLNAKGAFVIGMTLSANRKQLCVMNCAQDIIAQRDFDELDVNDPVRALNHFIHEAKAMIGVSGIDNGRVLGAGVVLGTSSAGPIGDYVSMPVLGWQRIPVLSILRDGLEMPVRLMSRSEALLKVEEERVLSEQQPSDQTPPRILLVNVGVGIGSAISGGDSFLGGLHQPQISHLAIAGQSAVCSCGRSGCLEQVASGAGVVRALNHAPDHQLMPFHQLSGNLSDALNLAREGNRLACDAFFNAGMRMAQGLDLAVAMLSPDRVLIAGEVGRQPDYFEGIITGAGQSSSPLGRLEIERCATRSLYAAGLLGLNNFLFSRDLSLNSLQTLSREAS